MAKGNGKHDDDGSGGRTPFFVVAFLLFIALLTLVTRSHTSEVGPQRKPVARPYYGKGTRPPVGGPSDSSNPPPPPPPVGDPAVEKARHDATVQKVAATAKKEFTDLKKMLETYWKGEAILADSWAFPPTHPEGIKFYAEKIARALEHGLPLTVGVIGSSVAAGHDNCAYDSFENQLQRTMEKAMSNSGIKFTVNNAGQGGGCGDNMFNQVWCLRAMVGDKTDFTFYSWTYFEAGQPPIALKNIHEAFIRWSLLMERAPVPTLVYAGDRVAGDLEGLFKQYAKFGFNAVSIRGGLMKHGQDKAPSWGDIGDSLHTTTRYGETANETRKKSLGVFYRNWHPGPLGFQVVADAIAWRFCTAALLAVEMLQAKKTFSKEPDLISTSALGKSTCVDQQDPLFEAKYCDVEEPPNCINHEIPTFGRPQVVYSQKSDNLNPMVANLVEDLEEKKNGPSSLIPRDEKKGAECMHADVCRGYRSDFMTYRLPRMSTGFIKVCCVNWGKCGERLKLATFYLDSTKLPPPKQESRPEKCVIVEEVFQHQQSTGGHFYLSINMTTAPDVYISHVIAQ